MPHFRLNIHNHSGETCDEEGQDLPDLETARAKALEGIRSFLGAEVVTGELDLRGHLDIVDETGVTQASVPFSEAIVIHTE